MKIRTPFSGWKLKSLCFAALLLSACGNRIEMKRANDAYQQAVALGDLQGQRLALLKLTQVDDGVAEYWIELAKIDIQLGAYGDAYSHFSRAHELDRTAVAPLSMMTELSVINGRVDLAENHLESLTLIAPNDRAVSVGRGFIALRQNNFAKAQENVDQLLAQGPRDTVANILQARIFVAQKKFPEAVAFLKGKLGLGADDRAILRSLGAIQRYQGDWAGAAQSDLRLWKMGPPGAAVARQVVSDALQAKDIALANDVTSRALSAAKSGEESANVLAAWVDYASAGTAACVTDEARLPDHSKIALAHYRNGTGRPDEALALIGTAPRPLQDRANVDFNAVLAESLMLKGQLQPARQILDRILSDEPDDAVALGSRARLLSRLGDHRAALIDAQRLVTSYDTVPEHRVLLAEIYRANRDSRYAERTIWDAYRDLPGNDTLYRQLQRILVARGDTDGLARLTSDHDGERYTRLTKELA